VSEQKFGVTNRAIQLSLTPCSKMTESPFPARVRILQARRMAPS
jgi:hypothetical protein